MKVFIILCKVHAVIDSIMPSTMTKAFVNCYINASSYEEAVNKILNQFTNDGIYLDEIESPIYEMPVTSWQLHIQEQYKSLSNEMLNQIEFENKIAKGEVVYGIFSGFN
ncbi:hypothetical protein [Acinetobacter seifertii]|uniref:Uncharacterized protein n=1 Tax=Acinetobacter seifertii TaxID=1530123 RepID=A0A7H2V4C9_9GAMM|nr:hypothetical protein [Acinetobacter seifertii]MBZ6532275.1 hypothetical protein [Acinetobacter seifertii]QNX71212.1 hypothetical protein IC776_12070 [Acinetobacter seifertii]